MSPKQARQKQPGRARPSAANWPWLAVAAALVLAIAAGFYFHQRQAEARPDRIVVETESGRHVFSVEWAVTPEERSQGLMHRTDLGPDQGMVFDFATEQNVSFWMKNTPLSLDMIFIKESGAVYRIARNTVPFSEAMVPSGAPVRYVLEVLAGTSERIGLKPGDRVRLTPGS